MMTVEIPEGYTPGPWFLCDDDWDSDYSVSRDDDDQTGLAWMPVLSDVRGEVALIVAPHSFALDRELDANARLIALAPEMAAEIAALRAEVEELRTITPEKVERALDAYYSDGKIECREMMRAALAAALSQPAPKEPSK